MINRKKMRESHREFSMKRRIVIGMIGMLALVLIFVFGLTLVSCVEQCAINCEYQPALGSNPGINNVCGNSQCDVWVKKQAGGSAGGSSRCTC